MVDRGTISEEERRNWNAAIKGVFVALVAVSAALIGVQGGADLAVIGGLVLAGAAFGVGLVWYLSRLEF